VKGGVELPMAGLPVANVIHHLSNRQFVLPVMKIIILAGVINPGV